MLQEVKFFMRDGGLFPLTDLQEGINEWIEEESKNLRKVKVDAISHAVNTANGNTRYSVMLLYHYE